MGAGFLVYNDTTPPAGNSPRRLDFRGRRPHLEMDCATSSAHDTGSFHYPAVIQGRNHQIHVVYSYSWIKARASNTPASMSPGFLQGDSK